MAGWQSSAPETSQNFIKCRVRSISTRVTRSSALAVETSTSAGNRRAAGAISTVANIVVSTQSGIDGLHDLFPCDRAAERRTRICSGTSTSFSMFSSPNSRTIAPFERTRILPGCGDCPTKIPRAMMRISDARCPAINPTNKWTAAHHGFPDKRYFDACGFRHSTAHPYSDP